jgi:hypothetical protein
MSSLNYRNDFKKADREVWWTAPRAGLTILMLLITFTVGGWLLSFVLAPAQILSPANIRANYEWFHDANRQIIARADQIASHRKLTADGDKAEAQRLRIEIGGMQQSCRTLVAEYNSRSAQVHRGIFQGTSVPSTIPTSTCE